MPSASIFRVAVTTSVLRSRESRHLDGGDRDQEHTTNCDEMEAPRWRVLGGS